MNVWRIPQDWARIEALLAAGGVLAYPTESVYGLGGWAHLPQAFHALQALKPRQTSAYLLVAAAWEQVQPWLAKHVTPPPVSNRATTYLYPASTRAPEALVMDGRIAIRLSTMPFLQALCRHAPLLSTSANPSGMNPARDAARVAHYFPQLPIIDAPCGGEALPSRIIDWSSQNIIRP